MRSILQRVSRAQVTVDNQIIGQINQGLLVLLAVHKDDQESAITKMADKILNLRIFSDSDDKMNLSVKDIGGQILVVSQFTLYGDAKKGNRPSFIDSARPDKAKDFYDQLITKLKKSGLKVESGQFQAQMQVELINDGPVTITVDI